jgi:hypothetical protein
MAIRKWRHYLLGHSFKVKTDKQALKYLLEQRVGIPAQQKWVTKLLGFDFQVEYKCGRENKAVDALSRVTHYEDADILPDSTNTCNLISAHNPAGIQKNSQVGNADTQIGSIDSCIHTISTVQSTWMEGVRDTYQTDPQLQKLLTEFHQGDLDLVKFHLQNGLLFYKGRLYLGSMEPNQK